MGIYNCRGCERIIESGIPDLCESCGGMVWVSKEYGSDATLKTNFSAGNIPKNSPKKAECNRGSDLLILAILIFIFIIAPATIYYLADPEMFFKTVKKAMTWVGYFIKGIVSATLLLLVLLLAALFSDWLYYIQNKMMGKK